MLWVLDVNETLLDLAPLDKVFARYTGEEGLRQEWFGLLMRAALVSAATRDYRDFGELAGACAREVAHGHGTELSRAAVGEIAGLIRSLPAHRDVTCGLSALRARGHRLVALTNSPRATAEAQLEHAGLAGLLDAAYSAQDAGALKPAPATYRYVLRAEDAEPPDGVMVAAHDWDIAGAQSVGMHAVLISRDGRRPLPSWPAPDAVLSSFADIANGIADIAAGG